MADDDGLEPRVSDQDVSEIGNGRAEMRDFRNATTASFNAQRQDFVDLRTHVDEQFARVDDGFTEMRGRFDATAAGQQQIVDLLHTIIGDGGR